MTESLNIWTPERLTKARAACLAWQGTPFRHHMGVKGVGTDCIHFVLNVLASAEVIPLPTLPFYDDRVGGKGAEEILVRAFLSCVSAERIAYTDGFFMHDGDLVVFAADLSSNHCGFYIDRSIWHCLARRCVDVHAWEHVKKRIHTVIRINQTGFLQDPSNLDFNVGAR